jgi:broad specificity phosphatase PhoE
VAILLVRHGETEWSRTGRHTGRSDPMLTKEGERQARAVGEALRGLSFALVLSSPLTRARETARLAGFDPETAGDLAEWDYGEYDGLTTPHIREQVPDWTIWRYGAAGGESVEQLAARADRVVAELLTVDGDVLVFSHGHFLRVLTARWLELAAADGRLFALDSGTLSTLGFEREQRVIRSWNVPVSG